MALATHDAPAIDTLSSGSTTSGTQRQLGPTLVIAGAVATFSAVAVGSMTALVISGILLIAASVYRSIEARRDGMAGPTAPLTFGWPTTAALLSASLLLFVAMAWIGSR